MSELSSIVGYVAGTADNCLVTRSVRSQVFCVISKADTQQKSTGGKLENWVFPLHPRSNLPRAAHMLVRQGYKGPAISAEWRTILTSTAHYRDPCWVGWGFVRPVLWFVFSLCLILLPPLSFHKYWSLTLNPKLSQYLFPGNPTCDNIKHGRLDITYLPNLSNPIKMKIK